MALPKVGVEAVVKNSKGFMKTLGKMGGAVSGFGKTAIKIGAVGIGAMGAAAGLAGGAMLKLAADAAPLEGIGKAFEGLTADMEGGSQKMLKALQEGSKGMVTNTDLMEGFNKAAMLVSKDFAQELPNAMEYLGKVSAATGQDMGFMLDSLTTGIGRLSPMILDNLGIQVSLSEANEAYADSIGKSVKELTKQEQQTALMNQVMEKLAINTADMPDITDNAATRMAQFNVAMKNAKDTIGKALLPIFTKLMKGLTGLITKYGPKAVAIIEKFAGILDVLGKYFAFTLEEGDSLNDWLTHLPEPIRRIVQFFGDLIVGVQDLIQQFQWGGWERIFTTFEDGSSAIGGFLAELGVSEEIANQVGAAINKIVREVSKFISKIAEWISENIELKDVLIALGVILGTVILGAIAGIVAALAPVILLVGGLVLAVKLLRQAWETNWNGIRDKAAAVVEWVKTELVPWFKEKIPEAFQAVKRFWENTLKPALEEIAKWIEVTVLPWIRDKLYPWLKEKIPEAFRAVKQFWENTLRPALEELWAFIQDPLIPIIIEVVNWLAENIPAAFETVKRFWETTLRPTLQKIWDFFTEKIIPVVEDVVMWLSEKIPAAFEAIEDAWNTAKHIWEGIIDFFERLWEAINHVKSIVDEVIRRIKEIKLPDISLGLSVTTPELGQPPTGTVPGGGTVGGPAVIGAAGATSVSIPMNVTIANDMDLAVFEARVRQVVVEAIGA